MDKLAKGKGNLVRQAERVKELGAKPGKTIPQELLVQRIIDFQSDNW